MSYTTPTLVVIPAKNEAGCIGCIVQQLRAMHLHVLVVNDGSTDATAAEAQAAGAMVLNPCLPLGAWVATQTGIRYALQQGYRCVVTMDADGQHQPEDLAALLAPLQSHQCEVVIGACTMRGSWARHLAWGLFRRLTGLSLADLTSGFRAYTLPALEVLADPEATLLDYQDIGVLLLLRKSGMRIIEVPVAMRPRFDGRSRIFNSWWTVGRYMLETAILCLSRWELRHALRRHHSGFSRS